MGCEHWRVGLMARSEDHCPYCEVERLRNALIDTLDFVECHSNRWDGVNGKHPMEIVEAARAALLPPNAELTGAAPNEQKGEK